MQSRGVSDPDMLKELEVTLARISVTEKALDSIADLIRARKFNEGFSATAMNMVMERLLKEKLTKRLVPKLTLIALNALLSGETKIAIQLGKFFDLIVEDAEVEISESEAGSWQLILWQNGDQRLDGSNHFEALRIFELAIHKLFAKFLANSTKIRRKVALIYIQQGELGSAEEALALCQSQYKVEALHQILLFIIFMLLEHLWQSNIDQEGRVLTTLDGPKMAYWFRTLLVCSFDLPHGQERTDKVAEIFKLVSDIVAEVNKAIERNKEETEGQGPDDAGPKALPLDETHWFCVQAWNTGLEYKDNGDVETGKNLCKHAIKIAGAEPGCAARCKIFMTQFSVIFEQKAVASVASTILSDD
ncbi:hypothetical protein FA10DRAFT_285072 [Acaromyces ingoldii]|uniref:Protein ZIP4 homolog n=1 Tax=Acaromyces ingoldii TaxID=215250 RepID=A0A316YST7_9BASI|nr:hypothetical protein FA10DRAFT_285072 [Acaromyces ingoldii]PWN92182.1 hypothetical protein FA10DRAFT_285072 [Acaromyces ingoldii]